MEPGAGKFRTADEVEEKTIEMVNSTK